MQEAAEREAGAESSGVEAALGHWANLGRGLCPPRYASSSWPDSTCCSIRALFAGTSDLASRSPREPEWDHLSSAQSPTSAPCEVSGEEDRCSAERQACFGRGRLWRRPLATLERAQETYFFPQSVVRRQNSLPQEVAMAPFRGDWMDF